MKIDKKTLDMLLSLPDESLWRMICAIAASGGFDISSVNVTKEELSRLRSALGGLDDSDIGRAVEILDSVKRKEEKR